MIFFSLRRQRTTTRGEETRKEKTNYLSRTVSQWIVLVFKQVITMNLGEFNASHYATQLSEVK